MKYFLLIFTILTTNFVPAQYAPGDDFDGDLIINSIDLDDDNDGILDTDEQFCSPNSIGTFSNLLGATYYDAASTNFAESGSSFLVENSIDGNITNQTAWQGTANPFSPPIKINVSLINTLQTSGFYLANDLGSAGDGVDSFTVELFDKDGLSLGFEELNAPSSTYTGVVNFSTTYEGVDSFSFTAITNFPGGGGLPNALQIREVGLFGDYFSTCDSKDTDGDGVYDHFDLDSDDDGCFDSYEAGVTGATSNGSTTDSITTGPYGGNGLADPLQDTDTNTTSYTSSYVPIAISAASNLCLDSDNDGIPDLVDIDDDNDGITDAIECNQALNLAGMTNAPHSFSIESGIVDVLHTNSDGAVNVLNVSGGDYVRLNAVNETTQSALVFTPEVTNLEMNFWDIETNEILTITPYLSGAELPQSVMTFNFPPEISINSNNEITGSTFSSVPDTDPERTFTVNFNSIVDSIVITHSNTVTAGRNIMFSIDAFCMNSDLDGDGIPNHLDLDSDGDGCFDSYEAGVTGATDDGSVTDSIVAAPYGGNGLADALQATDTNTTNYASTYDPIALSTALNLCSDSDNDGIPDLVDIDDDNDGILDAVESPDCFYSEAEFDTIYVSGTDLTWNTTTLALTNATDNSLTSYTQTNPIQQSIVNKTIVEYTLGGNVPVESLTINGSYLSRNASSTFKLQGWDGSMWIDLFAPVADAATAVNDLVLTNTLAPNESFSKLRIYGVAGQDNRFRIYNTTFKIGDSFTSSSYTKPSCDNDLDGDGINNHLDLDSDGDGCFDSYEAGVTGATNDGSITDSIVAAPYGGNGLADALQDVDTNTTNYASNYDPIAISTALNLCADSDNDGIPDLVDIDDDNDGILDAVESPDCFYTEAEAFALDTISSDFTSPDDFDNLYDGATGLVFNFNDAQTVSAGDNYFVLEYPIPVNLTDVTVGNRFAANNTSYLMGSNDGITWTQLTSTAVTNATNSPRIFTVDQNAGEYKYYAVQAVGTGATSSSTNYRVSEITYTIGDFTSSSNTKPSCDNDPDGDGINNHLDLDSDGDGCFDSYEAGVTGATDDGSVTDSIVAAPYGGNGLADALQATDTNTTNYASTYDPIALSTALNLCADSDNDGIPDLVDIDDDNDGILDAVESPDCFYTEAEFDTIYVSGTDLTWNTTTLALTNATDNSLTSYTQTNPIQQSIVNKTIVEYTLGGNVPVESLTINGSYLSRNASSTFKLQGWDGSMWIDLSAPVADAATAVNDLVLANTLAPNESFSKLRIYGVAGQDNRFRIYNTTFKIGDSFTSSSYTKPSCDNDLDGDGINNHLDLDSDDDGCFDSYEAGVTGATDDGSVTDSIVVAPYGGNGLADVLQATDTNVTNYLSSYNPIALSTSLNLCADSDNDGIPDLVDIDDDNDGILDAVESPDCFYTEAEAFALDTISSDFTSPDDFDNLYDGATGLVFNFNDAQTVSAGDNYFVLEYPIPVNLTDVTVGNRFAANNTSYLMGSNDGITWTQLTSTAVTNATNSPRIFTVDQNAGEYKYYAVQAVGTGATSSSTNYRVSEITYTIGDFTSSSNTKPSCDNDPDRDGINNHLDLDSDGDGCFDSYEAGVTGATDDGSITDSIVAAPYGGNGLADALQDVDTNTTSYTPIYGYSLVTNSDLNLCADSDDDGIPDLVDIDDDNDGVLDTTEQSNDCAFLGSQDVRNLTFNNDAQVDVASFSSDSMTLNVGSGTAWRTSYSNEIFSRPVYLEFTVDNTNSHSMIGLIGTTSNHVTGNWTDQSHKFHFSTNDDYNIRDFLSAPLNASTYASGDVFSINIDASGNLVMKRNEDTVYTDIATDTDFQLVLSSARTTPKPYYDILLGNTEEMFYACDDLDSDGDGIPNRLDLDSDDDGCPDVLEAGVPGVIAPTDTVAGPYGGNGLANYLQKASPDTNQVTYTSTYDSLALDKDDATVCGGILPVELLNFDANVVNNEKVLLEWTTVTEINNDYFEIMRSKDGIDWENIGQVSGAGNSAGKLYYDLEDKKPYNGVSYYKLKQTDFDGTIDYSKIEVVFVNNNSTLEERITLGNTKLYPNPNNGQFTLENKDTNIESVLLYNNIGKSIPIDFYFENEYKVICSIPQINNGIYLVAIIFKNGGKQKKQLLIY